MTSNLAEPAAETTRRALLAAGAGVALSGVALGQAKAQAVEIIDIHAHILANDPQRYPPTPFGGDESDWARTRPETFEQLIDQMNQSGVAKAAMVQVSTYYGVNNSYLADCIAKDPKRFTGVCSIDTLAPDNVAVLHALLKRGMTGLRIFTGAKDLAMLVDPKAFPVWEFAQTVALPICISCGPAGMGYVNTLVKRYPKVKVILDHCGQPKVDDGPPYANARSLTDLAQFSNVYLKVTSRNFEWSTAGKSTTAAFMETMARTFGADHMAFGTDIPSDPPPMTHLIVQANSGLASLSLADRRMIMGGTAKRLYPILA